MLGLLGLRIFEATSADIADLGEEHGHRVLRVCGKGTEDSPDPTAASGRPGDRPGKRRTDTRADPDQQPRHPDGPARRHPPPAPPRRVRRHPGHPGTPPHAPPRSLRPCSTLAPTCATSRSLPVTPTRVRRCGMTEPARTWTATRTTSWPPSWPQALDHGSASPAAQGPGDIRNCRNEDVAYARIYAQPCIIFHN